MSSPTKEALAKIRELKQKLAEAESGSNEPIAIVSTACRFPKHSSSPEAFWESLMEGADETSELPEDRWDLDAYFDEDPDEPGKMYARRGTFLENIDEMDADFFGISPREATWIDPQQRLFLEVSWEALERAGWTTEEAGKNTGVFVGWMHNDYQNEASESLLDLNPYIATGSAGSFLCGRLSYYLGIQGPSLAVDTACSSSLVALHLACQSLRQRECDRALVGGVNVMVSPKTTIMTCKLHALSPSGHSRAFDASADGYLRGEGCGVVALRRLSDAQRDGDEVLAVISGSAITHNGFSSGLTAPNPDSQQKVIRKALAQADLSPSDVGYLEAHGTGTELGDPIEMNAAASVLGQGRDDDDPLLVGSVKTNLGHLEAAAGIAGVIKTVLSIQHGKIPAHLHFETPNPHIAWERLPVKIVTENRDWPGEGPRIAGVSAFGMSGTNAHIVIESPPEKEEGSSPVNSTASGPNVLLLSGKSEGAVQELATRFRSMLSGGVELADLCYSAAAKRRHFEKRAAVVADSPEEMATLLSALAGGMESPGLFSGQARSNPVVAWQFTGQGSQHVGMGRDLYESEPAFREVMDSCSAELAKHREGDLLKIIFEDGEALGETYWTQPALFSIHMALAGLMRSWGMEPGIVFGHSLGQYAAACVAGILDWKDGIRLIHERSRLTGGLPEGGAMAAVFASAEEVTSVAKEFSGLSIAAQNGSHTVISGSEESVEAAIVAFQEKEIQSKRLETSHAFHSELLDPILDEFEAIADSITYRPSKCPVICNVSGEAIPPDRILDGAYWRRQLREAVQFEDSVRNLAEQRCDIVVELGAQPFLTGMASACWGGSSDALISTLQKDADDRESIAAAVARLHQQGVVIDFEKFFNRDGNRNRIKLPTYPFQRQRHWGPERPGVLRVQHGTQHPLLGEKRELAGVTGEVRFENHIAPDKQHWLGDHRVFDDILFPGAGYVEMAVAATRGATVLENLSFEMPLMVQGPVSMQTVVRGSRENGALEIYSCAGAGEPWVRNVSAGLSTEKGNAPKAVSREELENACSEEADTGAFYELFADLGIQYGPEFQTIKSLRYNESEVLARLELSGDHRGYFLPPMLLDGAFQSLAVGLLRDSDSSLFLPVGIERYSNFSSSALTAASSGLWCHGRWNETEGDMRTADLTLFDDRGHVVARLEKLRVRAVSRTALRQMVGSGSDRLLYNVIWKPGDLPPLNNRYSQWLVVGATEEWNGRIAGMLGEKSQHAIQVILTDEEEGVEEPTFGETEARISASSFDHWLALLTHYFPEEGPGHVNGIVWNTGISPERSSLEGQDLYTRMHCAGILALLQGLRARKIEWLDRGLQIVTGSAISIHEADPVLPESTQFWGLGRVVGNEYPPLRCRLTDCSAEGEESLDHLLTVLLTESRESQVALRGEHVFVPRLVPAKAPTISEGLPVVEDATYLITGGLGMLGRRGAEWLGARGAKHIVLVSRREPTDSTKELIAEIEESGCKIHVMLADISQRESLASLLDTIEKELPPLRGILHAAGVLEDGLLVEQTWDGFEKVLAPKKRGAALLHELTLDTPLDFFVLYSSAASVLGSPGQANYATGNAYLDGLAHQRISAGLPALSVNFGPWNEGMAATETVTKAVELQGMTPLTADEAHEAVDRLFDNEVVQATMLDVDWSRMRQRFPVEAPPLLDELWTESMEMNPGDAVLLEKLREAEESGEPREDIFREHVQSELQQVLSLAQPPGDDVPLAELGLDSLMAVEFATRLQQQVGSGFAIPPTLAFDYPSVSKLTEHLMEMIDSVPAAEETVQVQATTGDEAVAIIGMGCRFPGAEGVDAYWDLLREGIDATIEVPSNRWDVEGLFDPEPKAGKMYTKRGGYLPDIDQFDAEFFGLSESDAAWMDPQHRMLLETSWQAMEDAGLVPGRMSDSQVGVFMGIMSTDYAQLRESISLEKLEGSQGAGLSHSAGVGRISYMFGFEGPSLAIDTASSSSLVAVCQAAKSLLDGDCNLALAGGVNAILSPVNSLLLCKGGVLSPDGRCKSFSASADGFGRGEGCGVIAMKRHSDAERDGDRILAVIRGTAIGHNGHNGGLTAPSGKSQQQMMRRALANAGLKPTDVHYLEAHATGTELGDPIELRAAAEVLGKGRDEEKPLLVGSAKANLSHLEAAGGISGLIKVVLSMQHGIIPRQIHFEEPSPHIPWDQIRAKVVEEETEWPDPEKQIAGINGLGMTGTNAHVLLEGGGPVNQSPAKSEKAARSHQLLVLSGKTEIGLRELSAKYAVLLESLDESGYGDLCDSAAIGRRHFENRLAVVADSPSAVRSALEGFVSGEEPSSLVTGNASGSPKVAWAFSGVQDDLIAWGRELYEVEDVFRNTIQYCDKLLDEGDEKQKLSELLYESEDAQKAQDSANSLQFALQMAVAKLWESWGVQPDVVVGDGVGTYAAACAGGMMDWEDGLRLAAKREELIGGESSPSSEVLDQFEEFADTIDHRPPDRPVICALSGDVVPVHKVFGGSYWRDHLIEPVLMKESSAALQSQECQFLMEMGPSGKFASDLVSLIDDGAPVVSEVSREDLLSSSLGALGDLYVAGLEPDFLSFGEPWRNGKVKLPTYPFQRRRYWLTDARES